MQLVTKKENDQYLLLNQVQLTKDNGSLIQEKALEFKNGSILLCMKDSGRKTYQMVKANLHLVMVIFIMDNG